MKHLRVYGLAVAISLLGLLGGYLLARWTNGATANASRLCMMTLRSAPSPCDRLQVLINDRLVGVYHPAASGDEPRYCRIFFEGGKQTHFVFRLFKGDSLCYQPEFDYDATPGTMLDAQFQIVDARPEPEFGPGPDRDFPSVQGSPLPGKVWCWFGRANYSSDEFHVNLCSAAAVAGFKARVGREKYAILREGAERSGRNPWFDLRPRPGMTVVEGLRDVELWKGVRSVDPISSVVY